ncbi:hypothetical protein HanIR_Chr02g0084071 [Helianthus annuus]|nr:hypothetical protein HanIR_Chr02g0084071 [Helianthus annuus]
MREVYNFNITEDILVTPNTLLKFLSSLVTLSTLSLLGFWSDLFFVIPSLVFVVRSMITDHRVDDLYMSRVIFSV